ncbi:MAG: threonine-phosphate decarboxylase CobD [Desulfuromonadaceae bacterium]|nr:threonine-phosphate decarboxylase CobD [Desulfuromonadaceae bacterium]
MSNSYNHGGNVFTVARTLGVSPEQMLDFSASINPLGMSPLVRKTLINSLDSLVHYPDISHKELKQSLANHHGLSSTNFTIANGSTELIYNLPAMLSGNKALIISPSFSEYVGALNQCNWQVEHFVLAPESDFSIDIAKLERALAGGVNALFLCNPGNPSGTLYKQSVIESICRLCQSAGTFLVLDEAFMDFCEEASAKQIIVQSDNAVILRSMTKFFGIPGLRLGYAICNDRLAERLDSMGGPWSVNTLALVAGEAALHDAAHNKKTVEYIQQQRKTLIERLDRLSPLKLYPSSANYLLIEIMNGQTSREIKEQLLGHRIMIRDCANFTGLTDRFFRIAVRTSKENTLLIENLGRILK